MDHQQWLNWRKRGIGGSDASVIMKVSPWKTPHELWEEKVFGIEKSFENSSMKRGKDLEETARMEFEKLMGVIVAPDQREHKDLPWMRASLDGIDIDGKVLVEIKCPNRNDHLTAVGKKVPEKYIPQCQHYLEVTGLSGMYYFSFDGTNGVVVEVARDEKYIQNLLAEEKQFWDMVLNKIPPEKIARDIQEIDSLEWELLSEEWKETSVTLSQFEEKEKSLREQLIKASNGISSRGNGISLSFSDVSGGVDYKRGIVEYVNMLKEKYPTLEIPSFQEDVYRKNSFKKCTIRNIQKMDH